MDSQVLLQWTDSFVIIGPGTPKIMPTTNIPSHMFFFKKERMFMRSRSLLNPSVPSSFVEKPGKTGHFRLYHQIDPHVWSPSEMLNLLGLSPRCTRWPWRICVCHRYIYILLLCIWQLYIYAFYSVSIFAKPPSCPVLRLRQGRAGGSISMAMRSIALKATGSR